MKRRIAQEMMVGRTIKSVIESACGDEVIIQFMDSTFVGLASHGFQDDQGGCQHIIEVGADIYLPHFGDVRLVEAGIATQNELDQLRARDISVGRLA